MRLICTTCSRPTIRAREIDGHIIWIDEPDSPTGQVAVIGDLNDEPTALWNFEPEDVEFWNLKEIPLKYNKHDCRIF
jgi:hypothetical protein